MKEVRLGIIGLGNMGSVHARENAPKLKRAKLTAVCDVDPRKMEPYDGVAKFEQSEILIRSGLVDAIIIATPHFSHTTIGIDAFNHGVNVLTEKPISAHKADAERLIAAHKSDLKFAAMFQTRTSGIFQTVRDLVKTGELGEIRRINWIITNWFRSAAYYSSGGWRASWKGEGGGILLNQCPHNLDMYQWIFGMPEKVTAFCEFGKFHLIEVEDSVTAYLEHANGARAVFIATTGEAPGTDRLEIAGDRGRLILENGQLTFDRTLKPVQEFSDTTTDSFPNLPAWKCLVPSRSQGPSHFLVLQNFVDAILDDIPLIAPAEEGKNSIELANAMLYSAWTGATVHLPLDSVEYETALQDKIHTSTFHKLVNEQTVSDMTASFH